jgi:hypothetical protein
MKDELVVPFLIQVFGQQKANLDLRKRKSPKIEIWK